MNDLARVLPLRSGVFHGVAVSSLQLAMWHASFGCWVSITLQTAGILHGLFVCVGQLTWDDADRCGGDTISTVFVYGMLLFWWMVSAASSTWESSLWPLAIEGFATMVSESWPMVVPDSSVAGSKTGTIFTCSRLGVRIFLVCQKFQQFLCNPSHTERKSGTVQKLHQHLDWC